MKKNLIERFINKYHLNGVINSAIWVKGSGTLRVEAMTDDKKLFAGVTLKDFDGVTGKITFDRNGDPTRKTIFLKTIENEKYVTLKTDVSK